MEHKTVGINIDHLAIYWILLYREAWLVEIAFAYRVCWHCTSQWCRIHDWLSGLLGPWRSSPLQSPSHMSHPVNAHKQTRIPQCLRQEKSLSLPCISDCWLCQVHIKTQNLDSLKNSKATGKSHLKATCKQRWLKKDVTVTGFFPSSHLFNYCALGGATEPLKQNHCMQSASSKKPMTALIDTGKNNTVL